MQIHPPFQYDLTRDNFKEIKATISTKTEYGMSIPVKEDTDSYALAKMVKAFLIADHNTYDISERIEMATAFIERYELEEAILPKALLQLSNAFYQYLGDHFVIKKIHRKYPVRHFRQGRLFETIIDFILETDQGLIIIQNSGFAGGAKKWKNKSLELVPWLHLSKEACHLIFQRNKVRTLVHFVLGGSLVAVETKVNTAVKV